jgi:ABC-type transporter Mla MlaB component
MECLTISQTLEGKTIAFKGSCTIENAQAIATELGREMTGNEDIFFDLAAVESADLSFFQLLSACRRSYNAKKGSLTFRDLPEDLSDMARKSGFDFASPGA